MKKHIRNIHIDKNIWKYVIYGYYDYPHCTVNIYSPSKKLYKISIDKFENLVKIPDGIDGEYKFNLTPGIIKKYILNNILVGK